MHVTSLTCPHLQGLIAPIKNSKSVEHDCQKAIRFE